MNATGYGGLTSKKFRTKVNQGPNWKWPSPKLRTVDWSTCIVICYKSSPAPICYWPIHLVTPSCCTHNFRHLGLKQHLIQLKGNVINQPRYTRILTLVVYLLNGQLAAKGSPLLKIDLFVRSTHKLLFMYAVCSQYRVHIITIAKWFSDQALGHKILTAFVEYRST